VLLIAIDIIFLLGTWCFQYIHANYLKMLYSIWIGATVGTTSNMYMK